MRKIISSVVLPMVLITLLLASCDKKEEVSTAVELLSFGPSGLKHGDEMQVIGNNLSAVTSVILSGATVDASAFKVHTQERISFIIPEAATSGKIILVTPQGNIESKAAVNFEVPVVITGMPATARPGDEITITGEFMNWVESVEFTDAVFQTEFISKSLTELKLKVPAMARTGTLLFHRWYRAAEN
ncbi:MAG: hypothetical protein QM664_10440 [Flavihumibacter sp.]